MKKYWKSFGLYAVIFVVIAILIAVAGQKGDRSSNVSYTYSDLITALEQDRVKEIQVQRSSEANDFGTVTARLENGETIRVNAPSVSVLQERLDNKAAEDTQLKISVPDIPKTSILTAILPSLIMMIIMVIIFTVIFQKMQGGGGGKMMSFGKSKAKMSIDEKDKVTFANVAGLDEEKGELIEIVDFLKNPKAYLDMGAKIPKGILLYGKPGTGKTLIAKAIAGEAGVPFISMSGSEFIEMFAGLGASRVRKLFDKAKKMAPCIIFIDEIDAIGSRRTSSSGAESENNQTLNQLLVEMDGFASNETIIVLAATNRPEMLDKALLRPGRFDRQITIPAPDLNGREEILKLHSKNKKLADDVDFREFAGDTAGFTGAELANVLNESAIIAAREKHEAITKADIENAVKKITVGLEKHNRVVSEKDKKLTAYHEAGHAVVSKFLQTQTDVKEVSIIPRGLAGGYTMYKTNEDKFYISRTELLEKMVALMGGRAAEKISLNEISTGASNDIEVATGIARDMLTIYGMSDTLGQISLKVDEPYELQMYGENIFNEVGNQVKLLIDNAYITAQKILIEHRDILDQVALALLEKETISEEEFQEFFK